MIRRRGAHGYWLPEPLPADRATACAHCGQAFTRRQVWLGNRYCSNRCNRLAVPVRGSGPPQTVRAEVLALLAGGRNGYWMSTSDLAILEYGDDGPHELHMIRMTLMRLRQDGHQIESRRGLVNWARGWHWTNGYRLVADERREGRAA